MRQTLTENQKRAKQPARFLNPDERFVRQIWARLRSGEDVRVWLGGFNYSVEAICYKRGDILALTCDGWKLCTVMSFTDVRLTKEYWNEGKP